MNFTTTIVLLALLIFVGGYFLLFERESQSTNERERIAQTSPSKGGTPLFDTDQFDASAVKNITIEKDDQTIVLAKQDSDWWQTEPVRAALNSWSVSDIPEDAAKLSYVEKFKPGVGGEQSPEQLGLAPAPKAIVTIQTEGDKAAKHTFKLGRKISGYGYLMLNDDPTVYVVKEALHDRVLDKNPLEWRKTSIDGPKEGEADHVKVQLGDQAFAVAKTDGNWSLESPHSGRVDRKNVETLLSDIDGFYISKFIKDQPQDLSIYGLDKPANVISIRKPAPPQDSEDGDSDASSGDDESADDADQANDQPQPTIYTLSIGAPVDLKKESFFATWAQGDQGGDIVFTLSKSSVEKLDKQVDDVRDARITPLASADTLQLTIQTPEHGTIHLLRSAGTWGFEPAAAPPFSADDGETADLVDAITGAKATTYAPDAKPEGEPLATITLGATARPDPDVLRVYKSAADDKHMVVRNNETTGYLVASNDLAAVFEPALALRDRLVLDLAASSISRVSLKRPDGTAFVFEREIPPPPAAPSAPQTTAQDASEQDQANESGQADAIAAAAQDAESNDADVELPAPTSQPASQPAPQTPQPGPWRMIGFDAFELTAVQDLAGELTPLNADAWLTADAQPGAAAHSIEIQGEGQTVTMLVNSESRVATATGVDTPFKVMQSLADAVSAEMRYRTILSFSTTDIVRINVTRDGTSLVLKKDENDDYVSESGQKIDDSAAGGLFDTVAGLRVDHYVDGGPVSDAQITIEVELADAAHAIAIAEADDAERHISIGDQRYQVGDSVFEKLTAKVGEQ